MAIFIIIFREKAYNDILAHDQELWNIKMIICQLPDGFWFEDMRLY